MPAPMSWYGNEWGSREDGARRRSPIGIRVIPQQGPRTGTAYGNQRDSEGKGWTYAQGRPRRTAVGGIFLKKS